MTNTLFYGDNLDILRAHLADASVDLIYLDPPFNSNRSYNVLFKEADGGAADAQIQAFDDTWHWSAASEATLREIEQTARPHIVEMITAIVGFVGRNDVSAYLVMMTVRLIELHRVLKPTGSIYLHCDPTASHYLKVVMDTVFGKENYLNEIIWRRSLPHGNVSRSYGRIHDVLLFYGKSGQYLWTKPHKLYFLPDGQLDPEVKERLLSQYTMVDEATGRRYQATSLLNPNPNRPNLTYEFHGQTRVWRWTRERMLAAERDGKLYFPRDGRGVPREKRYLDEQEGYPLQDIWNDIVIDQVAERLGYPTQKPLALLERIIAASSNPGDVVLDPFCGCGTAVVAAQKLGRRWLGIDITHLAVALMESRLHDMFGDAAVYEVVGVPKDEESARALAEQDRHQFEWWALSLIKARPAGDRKKGADQGVDGLLYFRDSAAGKLKKVVVQVKSGHVQSGYVRDLKACVARDQAELGFLISLEPPSGPMKTEALAAGFYHSDWWNKDYARVQLRTVQELLDGQGFDYPPTNVSYARAGRAIGEPSAQQAELEL